ncbi:MAG: hypothetical protein KAJ15_00115 [Spirochaetes bacterium]|nr:hypothetical protein [Spirochaetota bacterium]
MAYKGEGEELKIAIPITEEQVLSEHFALCDVFAISGNHFWNRVYCGSTLIKTSGRSAPIR